MRVISWNVRFDNPHAQDLIREALSLNPDILCLQELRGELIPWIRETFPHYFVYGCMEVSHLNPLKQNFLATITKIRTELVSVINYEHDTSVSFWEKFYFGKINRWTSRRAALAIGIPVKKGVIYAVNLHLPSTSTPLERAANFKTIVSKFKDPMAPAIYCGDFNVVDNIFFRFALGWTRAFSLADYKIDDRRLFDALFTKAGLVNTFERMSTYFLPWKGMQLDHILVPDFIQVKNKVVGEKRYTSDHRMIMVDIANEYYGL